MKKPTNTQTPQTTPENEKKEYVKIETFSVAQVRMWEGGQITFSLTMNGITIYGCRVVEMERGDFIGFPSKKGKNDKYYNIVYAHISPEDQQAILQAVEQQLGERYDN